MTCARVSAVVELARRVRAVRYAVSGVKWRTLDVSREESTLAWEYGGRWCPDVVAACDVAGTGRCVARAADGARGGRG